MAGAIGLSVGAAKLSVAPVGHAAVTRSTVLTLFAHRPPEVGLPRENPNLNERGVIIDDFVDRIGDPAPLAAPDGSRHHASDLLADALRSLLYVVTGRRVPVDPIVVAYPAHWRRSSVDALRRSLATLPEFREPEPVLLVPDAVAALTALQDDPGVPSRGIIAVCDFGATGTSVTFLDAARGFRPIAPTVRDADLSGNAVDQTLLTGVVAELAARGVIDLSNTSSIGSLRHLRGQCRTAKEQLSTSAATSIAVELPGRRTEVRLTHDELDDAIGRPLAGFADFLHDALQRSGIRTADLVAAASVGGGAHMPAFASTLSEHLRVPVITTAHPELSAAIGSGLRGLRGSTHEAATPMVGIGGPSARRLPPEPVGGVPMDVTALLPWSDVEDFAADDTSAGPPWYRHPFALLAASVALVLAVTVAAAVLILVRDDTPGQISGTVTTTSQTPTTRAKGPPLPAPPGEVPLQAQSPFAPETPEVPPVPAP